MRKIAGRSAHTTHLLQRSCPELWREQKSGWSAPFAKSTGLIYNQRVHCVSCIYYKNFKQVCSSTLSF